MLSGCRNDLLRFGASGCEDRQRTGYHSPEIHVCQSRQIVPTYRREPRLSDCSTRAPPRDRRWPGTEMKRRVKSQVRSHPTASSVSRGSLRCKMWPFAKAVCEAASGGSGEGVQVVSKAMARDLRSRSRTPAPDSAVMCKALGVGILDYLKM